MYPHDDVLQGLFSDSVIPIPPEVRRHFSEVWELMEPSHRIEVLVKLRGEPDPIARIWELFQITVEVIYPKEG